MCWINFLRLRKSVGLNLLDLKKKCWIKLAGLRKRVYTYVLVLNSLNRNYGQESAISSHFSGSTEGLPVTMKVTAEVWHPAHDAVIHQWAELCASPLPPRINAGTSFVPQPVLRSTHQARRGKLILSGFPLQNAG